MATQKDRALSKANLELQKQIEHIKNLAGRATIVELFYFGYVLKLSRMGIMTAGENPGQRPEFTQAVMAQMEEAMRYLIQATAKHGRKDFFTDKKTKEPVLQLELAQQMIRAAVELNSRHGFLALIKFFEVEVSGARDRYVGLKLQSGLTNERARKFQDYFLRLELDNISLKASGQPKDELIKTVKRHLEPNRDRFGRAFGVSLDEYLEFLDYLLSESLSRLQTSSEKLPKYPDGTIEPLSKQVFLAFANSIHFKREDLIKKFGSKFEGLISRLTFKPENFDEQQLNYHQVARQPLILGPDNRILVFPELILDSLWINPHYTLLEDKAEKAGYKDAESERFLNEITNIANAAGWSEVARNVQMAKGKRQLGDLDLILTNATGEFLAIEAKNHTLPLDVYFKDPDKVTERLAYQQTDWERHIKERKEALEKSPAAYKINGPYRYIAVSKQPEILSHFSNILCLSQQEFARWISEFSSLNSFEEICARIYTGRDRFTSEEMRALQRDGFFPKLSHLTEE